METVDFSTIRDQGIYVPASHFNSSLAVDNYCTLNSHRFELAQHLWLPSAIFGYNHRKHGGRFVSRLKAQTTFSYLKPDQTSLSIVSFEVRNDS